MYLRPSSRTKNGKADTHSRLVLSVHVNGKFHQETVAYLGELDAESRARASTLAERFLGKRAHQRELFAVLPLENAREMRIRCVVKPEDATALPLPGLGLRLPKRLRVPALPDKM